jgi:gliding motility-associated-like protein
MSCLFLLYRVIFMIKKIKALIFFLLVCGSGEVFAQFPYYESFKNSTAPDIVFGGEPMAYLTSGKKDPATGITDPVGGGYLRLTGNTNNQKGFIHNLTNFSSQYGLKIDFEYFTYGGAQFGKSADGITFFLYDASISDANFKIGGFGGSLGYAQYQTTNDPAPTPGITGGYLGIGLDEYGNFANPIELRSGGPGFTKSSVTLRGRGVGSGPTLPNSTLGNYRYLTHKQTTTSVPAFSLISSERAPDPANPEYRKVLIDLDPAEAPLTGYFVTVKIVTGGNPKVTHTVISNYHYPDMAPAQVRYGIASSTGFEYNYHEIRNLRINAFDPVPPIATNDAASTPKNTAVVIPVLNNDTDVNGDIDPATVTVVSQSPGAVITKNAVTGDITYTPKIGFAGEDTFYYTVKDLENGVSNIAKVTVQVNSVKPVGAKDQATTTVNTPVNINVQGNDPTKIDVVVIPQGTTSGASVVLNADGTIKYTPVPNFFGKDAFTYKLKTGDGLESDLIDVDVTVQSPPRARNDDGVTEMNDPLIINLTANDTDADGTVNKASIVIKEQPKNGVLSQPDAQGNITYTPKLNFSGSDTFKYTVKDDTGLESNEAVVTIEIESFPQVGIAKAVEVRDAVNGTFFVIFTFNIGNYAIDPLERVSITDDLGTAFAGAQFKVVSLKGTGTLKVNPNFNGTSDKELLDPSSKLPSNGREKVELILNILIKNDAIFQNQAFAKAYSTVTGKETTDASVAGENPSGECPAGDVSCAQGFTFVQLKKGKLYIPEGFSPNGDGINDLFVVSNGEDKQIKLEVFNRWGNRVYKSSAYANDWNGRCTEGLFLGQDLPVGTYYYIIVIDNEDKRVGFITINR